MTSILLKVRRNRNIDAVSSIQAKGFPPKDAICYTLSQINILEDRIRKLCLINKHIVIHIRHESEIVLAVRFRPHDLRDEALVEIDISDVHDGATGIGAVGEDSAVDVGDDVDVDGWTGVEAGEFGDHLDVARGVSGGHAPEEGHV